MKQKRKRKECNKKEACQEFYGSFDISLMFLFWKFFSLSEKLKCHYRILRIFFLFRAIIIIITIIVLRKNFCLFSDVSGLIYLFFFVFTSVQKYTRMVIVIYLAHQIRWSKMVVTFTQEKMRTIIKVIFQEKFKKQVGSKTNLISGSSQLTMQKVHGLKNEINDLRKRLEFTQSNL